MISFESETAWFSKSGVSALKLYVYWNGIYSKFSYSGDVITIIWFQTLESKFCLNCCWIRYVVFL